MDSAGLRRLFEDLIAQGAENIDLVTPTHFLPTILPALRPKLPVPVVYNCGGYERVETLRSLEGCVDIYLPDFKYADARLAGQLSGAADYFPVAAEAIREMASLLFPRKGDLVHLYEKHDKTLWEHFGLLNQIEQVHSREVLMPSGGRLVFDQTEALMAIDINSGKIGGKTNFEAMAFRTNMEAATAIARQLRLRDIGGQIVIDFIEMRDPEHCREVEKELRNAMKGDRARHDIGKMSSFGLLQIVRQRTGSSAISISMETCPHCKGTGQRRNMEWQSVQTLRDLHRAMRSAAAAGQTEYAHSVDAELGLYLLNHKRERLSLMEKEFHIRLDIRIEGISSAPAAPAQQQGHQHNGQNNGR